MESKREAAATGQSVELFVVVGQECRMLPKAGERQVGEASRRQERECVREKKELLRMQQDLALGTEYNTKDRQTD